LGCLEKYYVHNKSGLRYFWAQCKRKLRDHTHG